MGDQNELQGTLCDLSHHGCSCNNYDYPLYLRVLVYGEGWVGRTKLKDLYSFISGKAKVSSEDQPAGSDGGNDIEDLAEKGLRSD